MKFRFLLLYLSAGFLTLIISMSVFPFHVNAYSEGDISIDMTPQNPAPNTNTTITVSSYAEDLNSVLISWSVNGKKISSGIGQMSFSVNAPALGAETTVTATISLSDGDVTQTIAIKPSIMVLLWQANDSYVPPFYEGKAMPSLSSQIKVVAMPEIKSGSGFVNPTNMTYDWSLNGTNDDENSGYGKNFFLYTNDYLSGLDSVAVTASTTDQNNSVDGNIQVGTSTPKIEFYKDDPTLGTLWGQALYDGYNITGDTIIQAAPYFVSPKNIRIPFLTFAWSINDAPVAVPEYSKNLLSLKLQAGISGTSKIDLEVDNSNNFVETATKELNVSF